MTKEEKLQHCSGCYNDFYNDHNPYGVKECWSLKEAHLVMKKEVPVDQVPPWNQKARQFLNCYRRQRCVYVAPDQTF